MGPRFVVSSARGARLTSIAIILLVMMLVTATSAFADVRTDGYEYAPGETVLISGDGMAGGEAVAVDVSDPDGAPAQHHEVAADELGNFSDTYVLPEDAAPGIYTVVATGQASGTSFTTTFDPVVITCGAPGPSAVGQSQTSIQISWTDTCTNEAHVHVLRSTALAGPYVEIEAGESPVAGSSPASATGGAFSTTDGGLSCGTTYYYKIKPELHRNSGASFTTSDPVSASTFACTGTLHVTKFYDANANGINDDAQSISGWKIRVHDSIDQFFFTPVSQILVADDYNVSEVAPVQTNWVPTTPTSVDITLDPGETESVVFGNVCIGAGGGLTLGFWSNKNGQVQINDGGTSAPELAMLSALNLRSANGASFDPTTYTQLKNWLVSATATNMAYMLAAQLATMELNVEAGFVGGGALVYAPLLLPFAPIAGLNALGFISINDLMTAANNALGADGLTPDGDANRPLQEALKTTLDGANNNKNFVRAGPCAFTFA